MVEKVSISDQRVMNLLNDINLYIKFLEQRIVRLEIEIKNLSDRLEKLTKLVHENENKTRDEIGLIKNNLNSVSLEIEKIKIELKKKADIVEIKEIREFFDLFNPLKSSFTTREEVKRIVNELINIKKE